MKIIKTVYIVVIMLFLGNLVFAQGVQYPEKYKSEIREYLNSLDPKEYRGDLIIINLLSENFFDEKEIGIHAFKTFASHTRSFILFYNGEQIEIIKNYDPDVVLKQSIEFVNTYQNHLNSLERALYYKRIIHNVLFNLDPPGTLPPPPQKNNQ